MWKESREFLNRYKQEFFCLVWLLCWVGILVFAFLRELLLPVAISVGLMSGLFVYFFAGLFFEKFMIYFWRGINNLDKAARLLFLFDIWAVIVLMMLILGESVLAVCLYSFCCVIVFVVFGPEVLEVGGMLGNLLSGKRERGVS